MSAAPLVDRLVDGGLPLPLLRLGVRRLLKRRLGELRADDPVAALAREEALLAELDLRGTTEAVDAANEQHYEVPDAFFRLVLGAKLKYSCALYDGADDGLDAAESRMLDLYFERARLEDGQAVLELGCGWGSLTLELARRLPNSRIVALSNSRSQAAFIRARLEEIGRSDVEIRTADVAGFEPGESFDRIVSVEMFEHVRNPRRLLGRTAEWLRPGGLLFLHVFCHRNAPYLFEDREGGDWMARNFFTGGWMPSLHALPKAAAGLALRGHWAVSGTHYARSARDWRHRLEERRGEVVALFDREAGSGGGLVQWRRWRVFFLACEELFGFDGGREWLVAHVLFERPADAGGRAAPPA